MDEGSIPSNALEKIIGKSAFPQKNLFGKFARAQLRPLYKKFYAVNYAAKLSSDEKRIFHCWVYIVRSLKPRIHRGFLGKRTLSYTLTQLHSTDE